jgi:hypothetical protein
VVFSAQCELDDREISRRPMATVEPRVGLGSALQEDLAGFVVHVTDNKEWAEHLDELGRELKDAKLEMSQESRKELSMRPYIQGCKRVASLHEHARWNACVRGGTQKWHEEDRKHVDVRALPESYASEDTDDLTRNNRRGFRQQPWQLPEEHKVKLRVREAH